MTRAAPPAPRPMSWRDIPDLADLETTLFGPDGWTQATWWAELAGRPRRHYVVLDADGRRGQPHPRRIDGYAGLDLAGEHADIMTIAVAPHARRRGLGRVLLRHLVETAHAAGARHVLLEVRADNVAARALYAGRGFVEVSVRRRYYQPGDVDAHVLRLTFPAGDLDDEEAR